MNATARTIGFLRVWVFGLWLVKIAADPIQSLGYLPHESFSPVGVMQLVPSWAWEAFLTPSALLAFRLALCAVLVLAAAGVFTRPACLMAALMLLVHKGLFHGFGPVTHAETALLYAALLLPLFPCGDGYALRPNSVEAASRPAEYRACAVTLAAMLCATYFWPSANRVVDIPSLVFSGEMRWFAMDNSFREPLALAPQVRWIVTTGMGSFFLWFALPFVTAFELAAPMCLLSRRFRLLFVFVMTVFHVLAAVIMNVAFWENVLLFVLLIDLEPWLSRLDRLRYSRRNGRADAGSDGPP